MQPVFSEWGNSSEWREIPLRRFLFNSQSDEGPAGRAPWKPTSDREAELPEQRQILRRSGSMYLQSHHTGLGGEWFLDCTYIVFHSGNETGNPPCLRGTAHIRPQMCRKRPTGMGLAWHMAFHSWNWLLWLMVLACSEASSYVNDSSNSTAQQAPDARFAASSSDPDERISVFELDYDYVQIPYEVTLWILLASLAKIGKSSNICLRGITSHHVWKSLINNRCL